MKKDLYTDIKLIIETCIKDVMLYRPVSVERVTSNPFVMIELSSIQYENMSMKKQECNAQLTIHVMFDTLLLDDDDYILSITQDIYVACARAGYTRLSEKTAIISEEMLDYQIVIEAPRHEDEDAMTTYISSTKPPLNILE